MERSISKTGFVLSLISLLSYVIYTACFSVILAVNERFTWIDIDHLAAYEAANQTIWKYVGMACMIVSAVAYVVIALCAAELAGTKHVISGKTAVLFAAAFCGMICINYFVQITATRLQLQQGSAEGLVQFTQSFSISAINAINMLGWTVFYPISSLALARLFDDSRAGRAAKWCCIVNTVMMAAGLTGYVADSFPVLLVTMNLGLGLTMLGMTVSMLVYFKKKWKNAQ